MEKANGGRWLHGVPDAPFSSPFSIPIPPFSILPQKFLRLRRRGIRLPAVVASVVLRKSVFHNSFKCRGSTRSITMQQHGKNIQNGRPQHFVGSNVTKTTHASLDEFKYGFPSDGLAVVSVKWWGSSSLGSNGDISVKGERDFEEAKRTEELVDDGARMSVINEEKPGVGNNESNSSPQGTGLLSCIRKRAAEEGREALRLGAHRGHGVNKLDRRERKLLLQIFRSSMPSHLRCGSSQS